MCVCVCVCITPYIFLVVYIYIYIYTNIYIYIYIYIYTYIYIYIFILEILLKNKLLQIQTAALSRTLRILVYMSPHGRRSHYLASNPHISIPDLILITAISAR